MIDRKETFHECQCGSQVVVYVAIFKAHGGEYRTWICARCGRDRDSAR